MCGCHTLNKVCVFPVNDYRYGINNYFTKTGQFT